MSDLIQLPKGNAQSPKEKIVAVVGGGPAGLMAASVLAGAGIKVCVFEAMPSVGRKFLMAGKGGMNITHSEPIELFLSRYGDRRKFIDPMVKDFTPDNLRQWVSDLGFETFIGSSGRVFPSEMKAAPLLRAWIRQLRSQQVDFYTGHTWTGWTSDDYTKLSFTASQGTIEISVDAVVFALGGGSWRKLGANGEWVASFKDKNITVSPLKPSNCGFNVSWSTHFSQRFAGTPIQSISLSFINTSQLSFTQRGEFSVTSSGLEGSLIYALSAPLRDEISLKGQAIIYLDLLPDWELSVVIDKITTKSTKESLSNLYRKRLGIYGVKMGLLREVASPEHFNNPAQIAALIKALPITLLSTRPIDEAISTAGGISFEAVDKNLMITAMPGVFCAGEMLDWEAPTGGYLLTACLASGKTAAKGVLGWLKSTGK
jgi:uncharacterized flavoprotein (TIGR03862 family)